MSQTSDAVIWLPIVISLIGVLVSVLVSSFIAGSKYGTMVQTMSTISERLARIEGLFEMKLKELHAHQALHWVSQ